jgi:hypothetical protein
MSAQRGPISDDPKGYDHGHDRQNPPFAACRRLAGGFERQNRRHASPQRLTRISLVFEETDTERAQQFVLRWSGDGGRSFREISPPNSIREAEEYQVGLSDVTVLELVILARHQSGIGSCRSRVCGCLDWLK